MRRLAVWTIRLTGAAAASLPILYFWNPAVLLAALFLARSVVNAHDSSGPGDCDGQWSVPVDADMPYLVPFFPETRASYWLLSVDAGPDGKVPALRVQGIAPEARYYSLHAYDAAAGVPVGALSDRGIGVGAGKPFVITVNPSGELHSDAVILAVSPGLKRLGLVWRVYMGTGPQTPPQVTALDSATGVPLGACPTRMALPDSLGDGQEAAARRAAFDAIVADQKARSAAYDPKPVRFLVRHAATTPYFANRHVVYAFAPLDPELGKTVEIAFRPPPMQSPNSATIGVRYWSVCMGGERETSTSACLNDNQIALGPDGAARFVIGPGNGAPAGELADAGRGINRLGWGWFTGRRVLIVRQLDDTMPFAGGFPDSFDAVPDFDASRPIEGQAADAFIGDFAPRGRYLE